MDVKAPKNKYNDLSGLKVDINKIEKSINIIKKSKLDYEFRTTFIPKLLDKVDIIEIANWLKDSKKFYLQQFKFEFPLVSSELENIPPHSKETLIETLEKIKPYFDIAVVRGI
jgi:pyruvate formate lyase activating enzyme